MFRDLFLAFMALVPFAIAFGSGFAAVQVWRGRRYAPDGSTVRIPRAPAVAVLLAALAVVFLGFGALWAWALFS